MQNLYFHSHEQNPFLVTDTTTPVLKAKRAQFSQSLGLASIVKSAIFSLKLVVTAGWVYLLRRGAREPLTVRGV